MKSNPTTGFSWAITQVLKGENRIYEFSNTAYKEDEPKEERQRHQTGRGGIESQSIKVHMEGSETIQLMYGRPWLFKNIVEKDENGLWNVEPAEGTSIQVIIEAYDHADL